MKTTCSTSRMVPVRLFAGIARARAMLAGKAADAAAVLSSFKKSRRSVLMLEVTFLNGDLPKGGHAGGSLVCAYCGLVMLRLRLCDLSVGVPACPPSIRRNWHRTQR